MRVARALGALMPVSMFLLTLALCGCAVGGVGEAASLVSGKPLSYEEYRVEELPTWFEEELFSPSGAQEALMDTSSSVMGFSLLQDASEVWALICDDMAERGWICVESGMENSASFIREEGWPAWVMVTCVQVGDACSVVVQVDGVR